MVLQEWPDESVIASLSRNLTSPERVEIVSGKWGDTELHERIFLKYKQIDVFIMADCFYSKKTFPCLLSSISYVLNNTNASSSICIYHHRKYLKCYGIKFLTLWNYFYSSVNDSIIKYLSIFDLDAEIIEFSPELKLSIKEFNELNPELSLSNLNNFQDLFIIEFKKKFY